MVTEYYQIHLTISGELTDFQLMKSDYNKYAIGFGHIKYYIGTKVHIVPIIAGEDKHKWLEANIGNIIEIRGAIRNFRKDDEHFNVIKIFDVSLHEGNTHINDVNATCKLLGMLNKPVKTSPNAHSTVLYLLTNEKYNKHVRLTGLILNKHSDTVVTPPTMGSISVYKGYIQTSGNKNSTGESNVELIITSIKEREE